VRVFAACSTTACAASWAVARPRSARSKPQLEREAMNLGVAEPSTARAGSARTDGGRARPKVLFVISTTDFGGTESILLELARGLPSHGLDPLVCSLCPPGKIGRDIEAAGVPVLTLGMEPEANPVELVSGAWRVARIIDGAGVDVVQTLLYRANMLGAVGARIARRRPVLVSSQRSLDPRNAPMSSKLVKWSRRFARVTVAVSNAVRAEVLANEGVSSDHVIIIPTGVDTTRFACRDRAAARTAFGVSKDSVAVGGAGRLTPVKGFDILLDALAQAAQRAPALELLIAGDGPERERLLAQARALGVERRVRFLGAIRDLEHFYSALDVFALPSRQEGSPNALLEAMACGVAPVAATVGGVPDIVEPERSGLLVAPKRPDLFGEALVRLAADGAARERVAAEARARILDKFDIARTVEAHADLYRSVLAAAE
jgi:glycosyltransferase involved in cell wall biosynthesis